jgi:hypothetical protein
VKKLLKLHIYATEESIARGIASPEKDRVSKITELVT